MENTETLGLLRKYLENNMYEVRIDHMDLNQIANSGQCFRWRQIDDNTYKISAFGRELAI